MSYEDRLSTATSRILQAASALGVVCEAQGSDEETLRVATAALELRFAPDLSPMDSVETSAASRGVEISEIRGEGEEGEGGEGVAETKEAQSVERKEVEEEKGEKKGGCCVVL
jgi:hypothetical protein